MSVIDKYNKGKKFDVNTEGFKFYKLREVYESEAVKYYVRGLIIFNTKYGDTANAILDDKFISLPSHMIEDVKAMIADDEVVSAIKDGRIGFNIRQYQDEKHGAGTCYGVTWFEDVK